MDLVAQISKRPKIVCLCGSTRFYEGFQLVNLGETLAGNIVLTIGCDTKSDVGLRLSQEDKGRLDELHLRKIDLADEIVVINVGGYVGESTAREIEYAWSQGKGIRWLVAPPYAAYRSPSPQDDDLLCEYEGCSEVAMWWCDDGGKGGWWFCRRHVFLFGYPVS